MGGKWLAISAAAVALGMGIGALTVRTRRPVVAPPKQPAASAIADAEVPLTGRVRPQHLMQVLPTVSGLVEALPVDVGQDVYQGEVLARVGAAERENARGAALQAVERAQDDVGKAEAQIAAARLEASRANASVERARIDLERAQKVYERQKMLHDAGATPRLVYEKAEQDYQAAQQEYTAIEKAVRAAADAADAANTGQAAAKKALADRTADAETAQLAFAAAEVRAPADGVLYTRNAEVGKSVEVGGGAMFEIATDLDALEVAVFAQPDLLRRVKPGMAAVVVVADTAGAGLAGVVGEIKDNQVIVEFHSTAPAVRPGMQASVRLKLE